MNTFHALRAELLSTERQLLLNELVPEFEAKHVNLPSGHQPLAKCYENWISGRELERRFWPFDES